MASIHYHYQLTFLSYTLTNGRQVKVHLIIAEVLLTTVILTIMHIGVVGNPCLIPLCIAGIGAQCFIAIQVGHQLSVP